MKRVTITDVAERAGVSKSTVSHVINQTRFVTLETQTKVLEVIEELNYRPSSIARSLVSRRTKTAGLLFSDVGNPFYHEVIRGVEEVALVNGYSIFLCNTSYDMDRGMKLIQSLIDKSVDGVMFMSSSMAFDMVKEVTNSNIQAVVLDWGGVQIEDLAATIRFNFDTGIHEAVQYLVELGHRNIGYISGPSSIWTAQVRRDSFLAALKESGLDPEDVFIAEGDLRIEGGHRAFAELLKEKPRPTAVLAANDLTALGILWAARYQGLSLPGDLSVIGLDDIDLASKVTPTLTTIALPRYEVGKIAMQMLLAMVEDPSNHYPKREVATRLVVRESTARLVNNV